MRRPLLLGAAWTASAAAAVGLGFLAVSLVDASASPGTIPTGATGAPTTTGTTATAAPPLASSPTGEYATVGGTVYADCSSGVPVLAGAPAAGWTADDSPDPGEVEFESGSRKVEVDVHCADGAPVFVPDDSNTATTSGGSTPTSSSTAPSGSSSASPSTSGGGSDDPPGDDDGGDSGGGHGSDDPPGDDDGGDSGGGHGSDD